MVVQSCIRAWGKVLLNWEITSIFYDEINNKWWIHAFLIIMCLSLTRKRLGCILGQLCSCLLVCHNHLWHFKKDICLSSQCLRGDKRHLCSHEQTQPGTTLETKLNKVIELLTWENTHHTSSLCTCVSGIKTLLS